MANMQDNVMIRMEDIHKSYGDVEVLKGIDIEVHRGEVLAIMQQLAAEHRTMVVVTHEMSFARGAADRILYVNGGRIAEEGMPQEIFERPRTEELRAFLGSGFDD